MDKKNQERRFVFFLQFFSLLKSIEFPSSNGDQTENSSKIFLEQNRPIKTEQTQIKLSQNDSESKFSHLV